MANIHTEGPNEAANVSGADTAFGVDLEGVPYMDDGPPGETSSSSGQLGAEPTEADGSERVDLECVTGDGDNVSVLACWPAFLQRILAIFTCCSGNNTPVTVPRVAGNFEDEFEEFIRGVRRFYEKLQELQENEDKEDWFRLLLPLWNTFLQQVQGVQDTSAIISSDTIEDFDRFSRILEEIQGEQLTGNNKSWIKRWLLRWNMFLQARAGETLVTRWNLCLTIVGFIFYTLDLVSDIFSSVYYAANGQWWRALATLTIMYAAVIYHAVIKWQAGRIHCTGAAARLRYVASLLVNWPDLEQYGALCRVEWKLHKSPKCSAHLVPEWHMRRTSVALLKYTEGVWEACPQAILQLCLLVPDLYGHWTWTDYLRIAGASVSLCTAGAALVNLEKFRRINRFIDLPPRELVALHVWAVPVTVSRLLSVALLLSVHLYWGLAGVALLLVLHGVYRCRTKGDRRTLGNVIEGCLYTLRNCMSPFDVAGSVTSRRVLHAVHFLVNTGMMVVWALGTPLACAHPALYTALIGFNAAMFAVGLVAWQLYERYWLGSYS